MSGRIEFRLLNADEIDCRVGQVNGGKSGCTLLLYKNARVDMNLLDEVVGPFAWKRKHEVVNGNLFCTVSVFHDGEWIDKQDVGTESNTEKEKGEASDSFKRACVNWGIGRELYTAPFIWINLEAGEIFQRKDGKYGVNQKFFVTEIEYSERNIIHLVVKDQGGKVRYSYNTPEFKKVIKQRIDNATTANELSSIYAVCGGILNEKLTNYFFGKLTEFVNNAKTEEELRLIYKASQWAQNNPALTDLCTARKTIILQDAA